MLRPRRGGGCGGAETDIRKALDRLRARFPGALREDEALVRRLCTDRVASVILGNFEAEYWRCGRGAVTVMRITNILRLRARTGNSRALSGVLKRRWTASAEIIRTECAGVRHDSRTRGSSGIRSEDAAGGAVES